SGEHVALSRPDRGELRARRAGHGDYPVRRLPDPVSHLHPPQAPLDPRRLAASALADPPGTGSGRLGAEPADDARALEDLRQPATLRAGDLPAAFPDRRLDDPPGVASDLDSPGARRHRGAVDRLAAPGCAAAPARQVLARLLRRPGAGCADEPAAVGPGDRLPAPPGVGLGGCDRSHAVAALRLQTEP